MDRSFPTPTRSNLHISKSKIPVAQTRLQDIKDKFDENVQDIKSKFEIIDMLLVGVTSPQEQDGAESLLRAQIVFLESAFDYYLHELFEFGMIMMFNDSWDRSEYYNNRKISMLDVDELVAGSTSTKWFDQHIYDKQSQPLLSTNSINKVLDDLSLSKASIASASGYNDVDEEKNISNMFKDIAKVAQRRNEIAHNCDMKKGIKQTITVQQVEEYISIIENVVEAIHQEASNK